MPTLGMNLYWNKNIVLHFLHRLNNRAYMFEVGDYKIDLDYFCLKTPFFLCFHLMLGAYVVPIHREPGHLVVFDVPTLTTPLKKRHA